jgi:RND family efflux transporter MFP subunit
MRSKKFLKILLPVAVLAIGIASAWGIVAYKPSLEQQLAKAEPPRVSVIRAEPQTVRLNIYSQGVVRPRMEIDLVPEVSGKIVQLNPVFFTGGAFAKDELLASIDPRDYDLALAEAEARIAEARRQLAMEEAQAKQAHDEWRALGDGQPTPLAMREPQLAEARAKLKAAEADRAKARLRRSRCELRAPFAGIVHARHMGVGQYVQPGEKLAHLYSTDAAEVRLPLSTDQLAFLDLPLGTGRSAPAQNVKVTLTADFAGAARTWEGRIVRTEGMLDGANGQFYAVAEVPAPYAQKDSQPPLLAGLFVKAVLQGREMRNLFVLPPAALNTAQEALLVDSEQRLRIRRLSVIRTEPDRVLVAGGLKAGDRVIVSGVQVPVEGMQVNVDLNPPAELSRTAAR